LIRGFSSSKIGKFAAGPPETEGVVTVSLMGKSDGENIGTRRYIFLAGMIAAPIGSPVAS
uniref:Na_Ca_ex domain-containing protein n=1 Tax=Haemonchus placei TaxID=6290 RepID=A0A0N4X0W1_HAEPC